MNNSPSMRQSHGRMLPDISGVIGELKETYIRGADNQIHKHVTARTIEQHESGTQASFNQHNNERGNSSFNFGSLARDNMT